LISSWVGGHELEDARKMVIDLVSRIEGEKPLIVSDELPHYATILKEIFHSLTQFPPTGKPGRPKAPIKVIDKDIIYATVKKTRKKNKIIKIERKLIYGSNDQLNKKLISSDSFTINTSFIERSNGLWRLWDAHLARKCCTFAKNIEWLKAKLAICHASYNFVRPHGTLSTRNNHSFNPITPAMAAKITDHVWTYGELIRQCLLA
jgi:hypothetical protein